jgi:hypothetical protein
MGIKIAPDVFQNFMSKLVQDMEYLKTYLDDLLILTNSSFKDHLLKLEMVLARLWTAGMRVNISKSNFFAEQIEYLGYWITRQGIQPMRNNSEAILIIKVHKTRKENSTTPVYWYSQRLSQYVVSQKWASTQVPLTSLTSRKVKFELNSSHQQAFDNIKKVIGTEVLLCYPDFNKPEYFHPYTDASDHQLGAVIMQDKKPIAFYLRKLNTAQKRYTTTERDRELLSAIETWKEYKNILLGYPIIVFTDHKNNNFNRWNASDRVLLPCWLLLLEEYEVTFEYLQGKTNVAAVEDPLSRLDIDSLKIQEEPHKVLTLLSGSENNSISNIQFPMHTALIFKEQAKVKEPRLRKKGLAQPHFLIKHIEGYDLLCYKDDKQDLYSSIIETSNKEYCPGTINIYFIRDRLEQKRLSGIPWHGLVLHKMLNVYVPLVKYVKWQRRSVRNMACSHPNY